MVFNFILWSTIFYLLLITSILSYYIYYVDTKEELIPVIRSKSEKDSLIANNPVASARFFYFMIQAFINHVLGVDTDHSGLYGDTSSYYGTVEQQGRLTLHLHMLLWIRGALTPQEIRECIMDPQSGFQKKRLNILKVCKWVSLSQEV